MPCRFNNHFHLIGHSEKSSSTCPYSFQKLQNCYDTFATYDDLDISYYLYCSHLLLIWTDCVYLGWPVLDTETSLLKGLWEMDKKRVKKTMDTVRSSSPDYSLPWNDTAMFSTVTMAFCKQLQYWLEIKWANLKDFGSLNKCLQGSGWTWGQAVLCKRNHRNW